MFGWEIHQILKKEPNVAQHLRGIVSIDEVLSVKLKKFDFLIVNEDESGQKGRHWLVINKNIDGCYECFDSNQKIDNILAI